MFLAGDICSQICHLVVKSSKIGSFLGGGAIPQKSLRSVLFLADTPVVLKFRKDQSRDVDGIDSNTKATSGKQMPSP